MLDNEIMMLILDLIGLALVAMASRRIVHLTSGESKGNKILLWEAKAVTVYIVLHVVATLVNGKIFPGSKVLNVLCNMIMLVMSMAIMLLCILYVDYYLYQSMYRLKHSTKPMIAAFVLIIIVLVANVLTGFIYTIDENNCYTTGPGYNFLVIVIGFQLIYVGITLLKYRKKFGGLRFFPVGAFMSPILISLIVGIVTREYISIISIGFAISYCGITMGFLEEIIYKDARTGFYNEYYYDYLMSAYKAHKYVFESGIMLGINNLNNLITDIGYSKAVENVISIAEIIREELPEGCEAMYIGDGRFLLLSKVSNSDYLNIIEGNIAEAIDESNDLNFKFVSCHVMLDEKKGTDNFIGEINEAFRSAEAI